MAADRQEARSAAKLCPGSLKADGPCEHGEYDVHPVRSVASPSPRLRRLWRWLHPDLAGELRRLDDEKLTRLYDCILQNPRGIKGVHIRMVRNEIARRA